MQATIHRDIVGQVKNVLFTAGKTYEVTGIRSQEYKLRNESGFEVWVSEDFDMTLTGEFTVGRIAGMRPVEPTQDEIDHDAQVKRDNQRDESRINRNRLR